MWRPEPTQKNGAYSEKPNEWEINNVKIKQYELLFQSFKELRYI